jgi:phospholipid/cholesterol/gamma-HCH transport system substrate-binding protein
VIRTLRKSARNVALVLGLMALALGVGAYILENQRVRFPFFEPEPFVLKAELETGQAITPGQGQTVAVSGVRIGDIGQVELRDGRAIVTLQLDPEYAGYVRTDATALLRPRTGLKDMFIELTPGSKRAPPAAEGFTIPVANTLPDVNLDEILAALDGDTRDYLRLLVGGAARGLQGRGDELREVYRRFEPTHADLARVTGAVSGRRAALRRLVSSLSEVNTELAAKDDELAELVDGSAAVFRAIASEDGNVSESIRRLPEALRDTRIAFDRVREFAGELGPAAERLRPALRELDGANGALLPFARDATPRLEDDVRPLVRELTPLVGELRPGARDLAQAAPRAAQAGRFLNRLFNMLGHNEGGPQPPDDGARDEGYLFYLAWLAHNGNILFSTADAHGTLRPITQAANCTSLRGMAEAAGQGSELVGIALRGLEGVLTDPRVCGTTPGEGP